MLQYTMGLPTPKDWSISLGLLVQVLYLLGFVMLAKTKAIWREA
jgi:ABC-2 type transport system permease protein